MRKITNLVLVICFVLAVHSMAFAQFNRLAGNWRSVPAPTCGVISQVSVAESPVVGWKYNEDGEITTLIYAQGEISHSATVKPKLGQAIKDDLNAGHTVTVVVQDGQVKSATTTPKKRQ